MLPYGCLYGSTQVVWPRVVGCVEKLAECSIQPAYSQGAAAECQRSRIEAGERLPPLHERPRAAHWHSSMTAQRPLRCLVVRGTGDACEWCCGARARAHAGLCVCCAYACVSWRWGVKRRRGGGEALPPRPCLPAGARRGPSRARAGRRPANPRSCRRRLGWPQGKSLDRVSLRAVWGKRCHSPSRGEASAEWLRRSEEIRRPATWHGSGTTPLAQHEERAFPTR